MNCSFCNQPLIGGYVLSSLRKKQQAPVICPHCGKLNENIDLSLFKIRRNVIKAEKKSDGWTTGKKLAVGGLGFGIIITGAGLGYAASKSGKSPVSMLFGKPGSDHKAGNCLPAGDSKLMISETGLLENIETHAKKINGGMPFDVSAHLRHLPDGRKASDFQIGLAEGKGIIVPEGMTYVKDFTKNK